MLKAEPLSVEDINTYGVGHVNMHTRSIPLYNGYEIYYQTAKDCGGYGAMQYYGSSDCGYYSFLNTYISWNCKNSYLDSEIKYVIDAWTNANINESDLKEARLITYDEFVQNMEMRQICTGGCFEGLASKYDWMYTENYWTWIGTSYNDSENDVWIINGVGRLGNTAVHDIALVQPIVVLLKSALSETEEEIINNNETEKDHKTNDVIKKIVNVPNTLQKISIFFMMLGIILISVGGVIAIKIRNKEK